MLFRLVGEDRRGQCTSTKDLWLFASTLLGHLYSVKEGRLLLLIISQLKIRSLAGVNVAKITASHRSFRLISGWTEPTIRTYCATATIDACGQKIFHEIHRKWDGCRWDDKRVGLNYWRPLRSTDVEFSCWYSSNSDRFLFRALPSEQLQYRCKTYNSSRYPGLSYPTGIQRIPCQERVWVCR